VDRSPVPDGVSSRVLTNYEHFARRLAQESTDLVALCLGLNKLVIVDVQLTRGADDPQLVFETMNSTGKRLSQADLIRNFVLMDLPGREQEQLYEQYWFPMEQRFAHTDDDKFDDFVRHYLTLRTGDIPRQNDIYEAFKAHAQEQGDEGLSREALVRDLHLNSARYAAFALSKELRPRLAKAFYDLEQLRATVVYPFLLRVYGDFESGTIDEDTVLKILSVVTSYLLRRAICEIPTNTLNTTFATLGNSIDPREYVPSIEARLMTLPSRSRFPRDDEFREKLQTIEFYHFKRSAYFFRKLENYGRKEEVVTAGYTVEHIMPQNEKLSAAWQEALGLNWRDVHDTYLHRLGNLTLTGYNSEYSDHPFPRKRDMEGGFRDSPLRLNKGIGQLETWDEKAIIERGRRLAEEAAVIWPAPVLEESVVERHRARMKDRRGFDWSLTHRILEQIPGAHWTTYADVAEAVGTAPQPLATHVASCPECTSPHRVMTSDGRVAQGFRWSDPDDHRAPREVLEEEGIHFIGTAADPEQRLDTEDLLGLLRE